MEAQLRGRESQDSERPTQFQKPYVPETKKPTASPQVVSFKMKQLDDNGQAIPSTTTKGKLLNQTNDGELSSINKNDNLMDDEDRSFNMFHRDDDDLVGDTNINVEPRPGKNVLQSV